MARAPILVFAIAVLTGAAVPAVAQEPGDGRTDWHSLVRPAGGEILFDSRRTWRESGPLIRARMLFRAPDGTSSMMEVRVDCEAGAFGLRSEEHFGHDGESLGLSIYDADPPMVDLPPGSPALTWLDALCELDVPAGPPDRR